MGFLKKIVAGGQTGVDQAALRAAMASGIAIDGWCPPGRICEDGIIPGEFRLKETPDERSIKAPQVPRSQRTEWNVRDSDGTLILTRNVLELDKGTDWTMQSAINYTKPFIVEDPSNPAALARCRTWIKNNSISTLHVAGPSEKTEPGIGQLVYTFLMQLLSKI